MEAIIYGGNRLIVHLCLLFNMFLRATYLPIVFMQSVIIPLVKMKSGDLSDVNNYRAIAISTSMSKLFECTIAEPVISFANCEKYQFGFKARHSTSICTNVLKKTVEYYTGRGSHVFCCFIDITKAFDTVNYWTLFNRLLGDNIDASIVRILAYFYCNQMMCVRWLDSTSSYFFVGNGTRQGGVLSPSLFCRYVRDLLGVLLSSGVCCNGRVMFVNVLARYSCK